MSDVNITIEGLDQLQIRMRAWPSKFNAIIKKTLDASLLAIWQRVGELGYPQPPPNSTYKRTGTLGRTLGTSDHGGMSGKPDVYKVKSSGSGMQSASFGTRLKYARYVIGDKSKEQATVHAGRWWTLPDVAEQMTDRIKGLFEIAAKTMARFLDGR